MLDIAAEAAGHTKGPTGYEISERYLREELHDIQEYVQSFKPFWRESGCIIMADGWTGPTSRPLINFLIYSTKGTVFHRSVNTSGHVKDVDYLFRLFDQVVDEVGEENVVQFVTDNEPSYKAAGRKLMEKREHLFWSPCAAHCIDLILERIGKKKNIQKIVANARMITTFIYNYSQLVALMRKYTDNHELLRPGITRFATNFIALESLYRHRGALGEMFASREWRESRIASSSRHTGAVVEVPKLVLDNSFWTKVKGVMSIMEPLIKVLKLVDGDEKPTMGFLYEAMIRARTEIEVASTHPQQYLEIIDELHHDLHTAGFFLNPRFQYQEGFEYNDSIRSGVTKVIERLAPNVTFAIEATRKVLDGLLLEYERSSHGPRKWRKLSNFLHQSLQGSIRDLVKKQLDRISSEKNTLVLKCLSNEDKLGLLGKQLEASQKYRDDYLRRYEEAISDKKKMLDQCTARITNLQSKNSSLEERYSHLCKDLDSVTQECSDWKRKYEQFSSKLKAEEDKANAEIAALKSRSSAAEARLAAAREQIQSAQVEASEWKCKYNISVRESKAALEKAATIQERNNKQIQQREDLLRAEFSAIIAKKEEEINDKMEKLEQSEHHLMELSLQLKAANSKSENQGTELLALKLECKELLEKLESVKAIGQKHEKEARILEQEKTHLEEKYSSEFKRFEQAEERCQAAEKEAKRATELADKARSEAVTAQREKSEVQRLAMERLTRIERAERHAEALERQKADLAEEIKGLRVSETEAVSKVALLEARVEEREKEIEMLMKSTNAQRIDTVKVLEGLVGTERAARAEANSRAESLSLQLQAAQAKLDGLQQELTSVRLNETALDSKLKTQLSHGGKRFRSPSEYVGVESVHDMDIDEDTLEGRKKSKSITSPTKKLQTEDGGSVFVPDDENNGNNQRESEDYAKFTMQKLKQELTKHGFGAQLLQLKNSSKKDILALYEKHVIQK